MTLVVASTGSSDSACHYQRVAEVEAGTYYVDLDPGAPYPEWTGVVVYEESNGIPGLQRSDARANDTCPEDQPDHLVLFV